MATSKSRTHYVVKAQVAPPADGTLPLHAAYPKTEEVARETANAWIAQMREDGAASPLRDVRLEVKVQTDPGDGTPYSAKYDTTLLLEASYYDPAQGLTKKQAYTSRAHDWHVRADARNKQDRTQQKYFACAEDYRPWLEEWGPKPTSCPKCSAALDPQNYFLYNGTRSVDLSGEERVLGESYMKN